MSVVLREDHDGVALITINRPQARNAINAEAALALAGIVADVERDPAVQVAILTGAGDKAFCAGADLKELASGSAPGGRSTSEGGFAGFVHAPREKLWIAAVNGAAVAGGFELMLACDFTIASVNAVFALPEVKRGLAATAGGVWRLPRNIARGVALEMIATGEPIDAAEALRLGLVNRVTAPEHLIPEAMRVAALAAANAPLALRASLALARRAFDLNDAVLRAEADATGRRVMASADAREGPRAFAEHRPPRWTGA
ncbi:enoyl-CoA hydratase-related protein [Variovorax sp. Sphag1AA]|uniref:enoyl-CoA hydratase-related protein n=1 Tax=Variovorax sp. Sphag1AA TaxID=2587027 RepID=UPI0016080FEF|nr:enoyl-CoA hydratase-related protein [Variovorax sp. Sphag1AA]MBB3182104.1 enoyl-CoA hydratase/carnithine racemase [Variovorax sp. Sphag1AA]